MDTDDIQKLSDKAQAWLESGHGQDALEKARDDARATARELEKARQVDPNDLHRTFTL